MSYHRFKSVVEAKRFSEQLDAERRMEAHRKRALLAASHGWLQQYRSQPRPTRFDWRPKFPVIQPIAEAITPPGETNGQEIIEGEFTRLADADASSEGRGKGGQAEGGSFAPEEGGSFAPPAEARWEAKDDTPF